MLRIKRRVKIADKVCLSLLCLGLLISPSPAHAMKDRTIVLRAAGSGALLGLGAGIVSYPFAKSASTIVAGVVVGALLGTVYGFHLADQRNAVSALVLRQDAEAAAARNGKARASFEVGAPFAEFTFDLR